MEGRRKGGREGGREEGRKGGKEGEMEGEIEGGSETMEEEEREGRGEETSRWMESELGSIKGQFMVHLTSSKNGLFVPFLELVPFICCPHATLTTGFKPPPCSLRASITCTRTCREQKYTCIPVSTSISLCTLVHCVFQNNCSKLRHVPFPVYPSVFQYT